MARGITQRTALGLSEADMQDAAVMGRRIRDWGNGLPFGSMGFEVSNTNTLTLPANATTLVSFNRVLRDNEGWMTSSVNPFDRFVVPPGGSGVYSMSFLHGSPMPGFEATSSVAQALVTFHRNAGAGVTTGAAADRALPWVTGDRFQLEWNYQIFAGAGATGSAQITSNVPLGGGFFAAVGGQNVVVVAGTTIFGTIVSIVDPNALSLPNPASFDLGAGATAVAGNGIDVAGTLIARRLERASGTISSFIRVNNIAVAKAELSNGQDANLQTVQWLNDGDIVQAAVKNSLTGFDATLPVTSPTATTVLTPRFSIARLTLL